jgi:hypothetical protein
MLEITDFEAVILDFNPIVNIVLFVRLIEGRLMVEPDAAPAPVLNAQHAPGRRRAPPAANMGRLPGAG